MDNPRSISACVENRVQLSVHELHNKNREHVSRKIKPAKKNKYTRIAHYRTPVLFATEEGLHLRLVDDRSDDSYYLNEANTARRGVAGGKEQCWTVEPRFLCEFCDVALIVPTPNESIGHPSSQKHFSTSMRRGLRPPVFAEETLAEEDLHVSDDLTADSNGKFARKLNESEEALVAENDVTNNRNFSTNNSRKLTRVRFAQAVSEIPLSESGVWSAPEDQGFVEQPAPCQDIVLNPLKMKPKVNVLSRSRMDKSS
jgi:hypothetical protein